MLRIFDERAGIETKSLIKVLDIAEASLYESDRHDVITAASKLELSPVARDACLERLRQYRHQRLVLSGISQGSIVVERIVAAVALYVLKTTVGESLKEG